MNRNLRISCILLCLTLIGGCRPSGETSESGGLRTYPYKIVASCGMVADIVQQVAGEHAEVISLMKEGVDPHLYKPTRDDTNTLMDAQIVFPVGLMLEGRMSDAFLKVANAGIPVHPVAEGIEESFLREPEEFEGHYDPHVWMDVSAWSQCVAFVAEKLAEFDPAHADDYRANAKAYRAELEKLDAYAKETIATIPEEQRVLITAHDAFGYYARAYNIPVKALQGISTESEAGVDDLNQLVDFIIARKIKAIFVESSVNREGIKAIVEGVASRGGDVKIGGELFSDAMGAAGTYEGTYVGMIDHNTTTIVRALGGTAPEKGLNGKLTITHE